MTPGNRSKHANGVKSVFSAGILEWVAIAMILAPIGLLIGALLFLVARRKKN